MMELGALSLDEKVAELRKPEVKERILSEDPVFPVPELKVVVENFQFVGGRDGGGASGNDGGGGGRREFQPSAGNGGGGGGGGHTAVPEDDIPF